MKAKLSSGFTLIELVVVIVILGILSAVAAPRFINLTDDANEAVFVATAAAFREGVNQVHLAWLIRGNNQSVGNFIEIPIEVAGGDLSVNSNGYPADTRGFSRTLNSALDCIDVWKAVLVSQNATVENDDSAAFQATYNGNGRCTYTAAVNNALTVIYDSNSGDVTINTP